MRPIHGDHMGERQRFTLEELAAATGMTPRNVRAYQTRGLISPPDRQGRRSVYGLHHMRQLMAVRRARADGATLGLISGVLTDGRRLRLPAPGRTSGSDPVPGTARRRADLRRALSRMGAADDATADALGELAEVRAVAETGVRTVVTADVVARLTQLHRHGVDPAAALRLAAGAARSVRPVARRARRSLTLGSGASLGRAEAELLAGLVGAVVRDSLAAELTASDEAQPSGDGAPAEGDGPDPEGDRPGSADGGEEFDLDRGVER